MVTGEKTEEYRAPSHWILTRLQRLPVNSLIRFTNGYGHDKPYFVAVFKGFKRHPYTIGREIKKYSNGLEVTIHPEDIIIQLGEIVETGNLK